MDEPRGDRLAAELGATVVEAGKEVGSDGLARFDFDGVEGIRIGTSKPLTSRRRRDPRDRRHLK